LDDERGNLSLTFCEIANAIDDVRHSRGDAGCIVFWENVPGVLNTKDNAFGCFIAGLAGCDTPIVSASGWTNAGMVDGPRRLVAWRVLDAQGFVPQRRRRVFVVAVEHSHWVDPRRVLFESQAEVVGSLGNRLYTGPLFPERTSLQRNSAPSREEGQGVASNVKECFEKRGSVGSLCARTGLSISVQDADQGHLLPTSYDMPEEVAHCLTTKAQRFDPTNETLVPTTYSTPAIGHVVEDDAASCITKNTGAGGETQNPAFVVQPVGFDAYNNAVTGDVAKTLDVGQDHHHVPNVFEPVVSPSLTASNNPSRSPQSSEVTQQVWAVMQATQAAIGLDEEQNARIEGFGTLKARMEGGGFEGSVMTPAMQVRRLTPVECERLQGFPDNYTAIPWRKKPVSECPDGPRYKALGNSWAVPVVRWIGKRIQEQLR
jgi:DNA (cytosine-5)-methyltransferase 1